MIGNNEDSTLCNNSPFDTGRPELLLVAEGLHVLNQQVCTAVTQRNGPRLVELARQHLAYGARALAVNLGPGRAMAELTPWVAETLRQQLAAPLFLSAKALDQPELLRRYGQNLTINAVTADPASLGRALTIAGEYGTGLVVLLVRPGLTPAGSSDRLALAAEVIDQGMRIGFPLDHLYLDPLLTLRPDPLSWQISQGLPDIASVAETITLLRQLDDAPHTIIALGNCARRGADNRDSALQGRVLGVLVEAGLDAVIINGRNQALMRTSQNLASSNSLAGDEISRAA